MARRAERVARSAQTAADTKLYLYDDKAMIGIVERVVGGWRAVRRGREVGVYRRRQDAIAAVHDEHGDR